MKAKSRYGFESVRRGKRTVDFIAGSVYEVARDTDGDYLVTDEAGFQCLFSKIAFHKQFEVVEE